MVSGNLNSGLHASIDQLYPLSLLPIAYKVVFVPHPRRCSGASSRRAQLLASESQQATDLMNLTLICEMLL